MLNAISQLSRIPAECIGYEMAEHFEWLALEAYFRFLNDQLDDAQRLFREKAEREYRKERKDAIIASTGLDQEELSEKLLLLEQEYNNLKGIEELHISERAWLSFFVMVWSVFERQFLGVLELTLRNNGTPFEKMRNNPVKWFKDTIEKLNIGEFDENWDLLNNLYLLRNAIVHVNGHVRELANKDKIPTLISFIEKRGRDMIYINDDGAAIFGSDFAQETLKVCHGSINRFRNFLFSHCLQSYKQASNHSLGYPCP